MEMDTTEDAAGPGAETLEDIVAELRNCPKNTVLGGMVSLICDRLADRIEAAAKREKSAIAEDRKRSKYERLHECFWDKRAVQCVIRQMLDECEDLSGIDPVSANRMEYYANLLIGATSDGRSFGNAVGIREALELSYRIIHCAMVTGLINRDDANKAMDAYHAAHSAPARNCDRFGGNYVMLHTAWSDWTGSPSGHLPDGTAKMTFAAWLLAPAAERKGEEK